MKSYSLTTKKAKEKMVKARVGAINLPRVKYMAFGTGGISGGVVLECTENQENLHSEILRKEIDKYTLIAYNKCKYECTLLENELVGESITEIGLVDEEGDILAIRNFNVKFKDVDMQMRFFIEDEF